MCTLLHRHVPVQLCGCGAGSYMLITYYHHTDCVHVLHATCVVPPGGTPGKAGCIALLGIANSKISGIIAAFEHSI